MKSLESIVIGKLFNSLDTEAKKRIEITVMKIVKTKQRGGKIVAIMGSGPNIHEGVTTLVAELIRHGIIDGVITSSAVIAHEMAGSLDRVKRVNGIELGIDADLLPKGSIFEITVMDDATLAKVRREMIIDEELIRRGMELSGNIIIKAAGNMGYPIGLRTEKIAEDIEVFSKIIGKNFEYIAGLGADERTMIGQGAIMDVPVIVSTPQLVGGGMVGMAIADSIPLKQRSAIIADLLGGSDMIIESALALSQEIHDGPFETYTGHGIWSAWNGINTFSLKKKTLVRIDLDPNLEKAWKAEKSSKMVQGAIDRGLPKTKELNVPFRMEMSGFARLEDSIPIVGDIGVIWPVIAYKVTQKLHIDLDFISFPQETDQGKEMREWIVKNVRILDRAKIIKSIRRKAMPLDKLSEKAFLKG